MRTVILIVGLVAKLVVVVVAKEIVGDVPLAVKLVAVQTAMMAVLVAV